MQQEKQEKSNLSFNDEIQRIADKVKADVEKELNQVFNKFQVVEHQTLPQEQHEPERSSYSMKVRTDENEDQDYLRLRTTRRDPFSDWTTDINEFFRARSPFESLLSSFDPFETGFSSVQSLADSLREDVERDLNTTFDTFDVVEHHPILTDPEHTSYYMRVKTNGNGHVRIKTIKKKPGKDWRTHVEEYYKGKPAIEASKERRQGRIEGASRTQASRGEQKERRKMEVEQIPQNKSANP